MSGIRIEIQPPSVARLNRTLRPNMVVSISGSLECSFIYCTIETAEGTPAGEILVGGENCNSPESLAPAAQSESGSSTTPHRGRQYAIFHGLTITQVGRFRLRVHASLTDPNSMSVVAQATSNEIEVMNEKVAKTKLDKHQTHLMEKLGNAGFFQA